MKPLLIVGSYLSPYVRKVLVCLEAKGIAYEVDHIVPFFGDDRFSRLSPLRRIPVLVDGDLVLSDSSVICQYLEDLVPSPALFPADIRDRARARWLEEFADKWPAEIGLPFDCILMANMVTEKHIALLKKAGCIQARIAFEAANDHMRNAIMKKNTTRAQLVRAASHIKGAGMRLASLNMLGGPGATIEDDFETVKLNIECKVDHPLASLLQPYPMTDINDITRELGFSTSEWDNFPKLFNRTTSINLPHRHQYENLHKWFPILVRYPWLLPFARRAIRWKWAQKPFLVMYMLYSEWLVTEQNSMYYAIQGRTGFKTWSAVDFLGRVIVKGFIRVFTTIFGQRAMRVAVKMRLNDERQSSHSE